MKYVEDIMSKNDTTDYLSGNGGKPDYMRETGKSYSSYYKYCQNQ